MRLSTSLKESTASKTLKQCMLTYRFATTPDELARANTLVLRTYDRSGYVPKDKAETALSIHDFTERPGSATINAFWHDTHCGTISIVKDSSFGLPADSVYKPELDALREQVDMVVEVCQFAVETPTTAEPLGADQNDLAISLGLFAHTIHLCRHENIRHLCFVINPKHQSFYEAIGAKVFGPEKSYTAVDGAPAIPLHLDLSTQYGDDQSHLPRLMRDLLDQAPPETFYSEKAVIRFRTTPTNEDATAA